MGNRRRSNTSTPPLDQTKLVEFALKLVREKQTKVNCTTSARHQAAGPEGDPWDPNTVLDEILRQTPATTSNQDSDYETPRSSVEEKQKRKADFCRFNTI